MLWTTIKVEENKNSKKVALVLSRWLELSCNWPLTIQYHLGATSQDVWKTIMSCSRRIEHLEIDSKVKIPDGFLSENAVFPNLRFLRITRDMRSAYDDPEVFIDLKKVAPQLSSIHIRRFEFNFLSLPSERLTTCSLEIEDMDCCIAFLGASRQLVDCTIRAYENWAATTLPILRHEKLEKLVINYGGARYNEALGLFLAHLELPSLLELEWFAMMTSNTIVGKWPGNVFLSFLSRSGCMLSKLWITAGPTEDDILQYLSALPSLIDIAIGPLPSIVCPDKLMQALTFRRHDNLEGENLVPNLEHLLISGEWRGGEAIATAIESRFGGKGKLKGITLFCHLKYSMSGKTLKRLRRCIEKGLAYRQWPPASFVGPQPPL
ncbi:hypothetical protein HWV62_2486 [Athelia sp. TMB]|nr:hypothetical protein HWV62_2486 [Athelia sp. TMB]